MSNLISKTLILNFVVKFHCKMLIQVSRILWPNCRMLTLGFMGKLLLYKNLKAIFIMKLLFFRLILPVFVSKSFITEINIQLHGEANSLDSITQLREDGIALQSDNV